MLSARCWVLEGTLGQLILTSWREFEPKDVDDSAPKLPSAMEDEGRRSGSSDFGSLLRRYRLAAGLSQDALAELARVSSNGISALERGRRRIPQRETLESLAEALAMAPQQRRACEAAAVRPTSPRRRDGASITVGPWPSAGATILSFTLTPFIGREVELAEIAALLREHRLVTITGAGGVGKTQPALRAATSFSDEGATAVCFVELAPIGDFSLIATAIATAFCLQEVPNHPQRETLPAFLKNKRVLLLLDNCEHVIAESAAMAAYLLHACPNLRILSTSREPLRVAGERAYRLPSLNEDDAVALFAVRALATESNFALTEQNAQLVAGLC